MSNHIIDQKNKFYGRALKREIGIWSQFKQDNFLNQSFHTIDFQYKGESYQFKKNIDWVNFLKKLGPFRDALILGGGDTSLENYLISEGIVGNIENYDIINSNDGTINRFNDLNFIKLLENKYDLIIGKSVLHHIINLEHLLTEVNKSLKPSGLFFVFEYVGENKQQWDQEKIDVVQKMDLNPILPDFKLERSKHNYYNDWPFESIRSEDLPGVLRNVFTTELEVSWGALRWPISYYLNIFSNNRKIDITNSQKTQLDEIALKYETLYPNLKPCYLCGLYLKNENPVDFKIKKWSNEKIIKELKLKGPYKVRLRSLINTYRNSHILQILFRIKTFLRF